MCVGEVWETATENKGQVITKGKIILDTYVYRVGSVALPDYLESVEYSHLIPPKYL